MTMQSNRQPAPPSAAESFQALLQSKHVLVADSSPGGASGLERRLTELGVPAGRVDAVNSWEKAAQLLGTKSYGVAFIDSALATEAALEQLGRGAASGKSRCRLILISSNTSQAHASQAARGNIDAFLIRPFSGPVLEAVLKRVFEEELDFPDYLKNIQQGEAHLAQKDFKPATLSFTQAIELNRRPALAHACLARTAALQGKTEAAIESYRKALQESMVHYESLTGLEGLLLESDRKEETYHVVQRLALYYPTDPKRLALAVRLAVEMDRLDDLQEYCEIFEKISEKPKSLVDHLGAALVVGGRHYLAQERESKAHELFERAVNLSARSTRFLRRIVEIFVLREDREEAQKYLDRFPDEARASNEYVACKFLVTSDPVDVDGLIAGIEALFDRDVKTPGLYEALLKALWRVGDIDALSQRLEEACKAWPHWTEDFKTAAGEEPEQS
jgi:tetratricopeptide (TPR) repeat protein